MDVVKGEMMQAKANDNGCVKDHTMEKAKAPALVDELADGWVDDDRITCNMCQHMAQHLQKVNMSADHFDKIRRENHIANRWMFDIVKIQNNWARVEYMGWQCNGGQRSYIPIDIKHRCDSYKPKQNAKAFNVNEWWE